MLLSASLPTSSGTRATRVSSGAVSLRTATVAILDGFDSVCSTRTPSTTPGRAGVARGPLLDQQATSGVYPWLGTPLHRVFTRCCDFRGLSWRAGASWAGHGPCEYRRAGDASDPGRGGLL